MLPPPQKKKKKHPSKTSWVLQSFDYVPQTAKDFENPKTPKTADPMGPTTCLER